VSLATIPRGARVFLDAPVFLLHFTGVSPECRELLERCERSEVRGVTSAHVLAQVAGSLARLAAAADAGESGGAGPRSRERPTLFDETVAQVPLMGVEVRSLDLRALLASAERADDTPRGVETALLLASAQDAGASALATTAADLGDLPGLRIHRPADLD
jgi:predicted nucleic acid-binding protein